MLGPLLGAAGMRDLTDSLGRLTSQSSLYIGLALLVVVYLMPNGVLGLLDQAVRQVAARSAVTGASPTQTTVRSRQALRLTDTEVGVSPTPTGALPPAEESPTNRTNLRK